MQCTSMQRTLLNIIENESYVVRPQSNLVVFLKMYPLESLSECTAEGHNPVYIVSPVWPITIWTKICLFLALYLSLSLSVKHTHTLISYNTVQWKTITNQSPSACGSAVMYILLSLVKLVKSWLSLIANTLSPLLSLSFSPPNFSSTSQRCVREGPQAIVGSKQRISLMLG